MQNIRSYNKYNDSNQHVGMCMYQGLVDGLYKALIYSSLTYSTNH